MRPNSRRVDVRDLSGRSDSIQEGGCSLFNTGYRLAVCSQHREIADRCAVKTLKSLCGLVEDIVINGRVSRTETLDSGVDFLTNREKSFFHRLHPKQIQLIGQMPDSGKIIPELTGAKKVGQLIMDGLGLLIQERYSVVDEAACLPEQVQIPVHEIGKCGHRLATCIEVRSGTMCSRDHHVVVC